MTGETETHDCSADVWSRSGFGSHIHCSRRGKYLEDDKWWCGAHAPSKIEARREQDYNRARAEAVQDRVRAANAALRRAAKIAIDRGRKGTADLLLSWVT